MARPVVTISAAFGTGGSRIAPAVADRLGVAFRDRAITREVARRLEVPVESALHHEQNPPTAVTRFLASIAALGGAMTGAGAASSVPEHVADVTAYRRHADAALQGFAAEGGVILGRAAAIALAEWPGALHVRLDGPVEARRTAAASRGETVSEGVGGELRRADRAREAYVRCFYGADARDPAHYHLVLDTTAIGLEAAVDVIVVAARARAVAAEPA
jgi:cytidylate kinase